MDGREGGWEVGVSVLCQIALEIKALLFSSPSVHKEDNIY